MNISADFGITVTDTLRRNGDELTHNMELSSKDLNHQRIRELFPDMDFTSNQGFLAVTGGRHLELGNEIGKRHIIDKSLDVFELDIEKEIEKWIIRGKKLHKSSQFSYRLMWSHYNLKFFN